MSVIAIIAAGAAAAVGAGTAANPHASPAHLAVAVRVTMILSLVAAGIYAQTSRVQARMGRILVAAGLLSSLWLLNGSSTQLLFTIGVLCAGPATVGFYWIALAHPSGHVRRSIDRWLVWSTGGTLVGVWIVAALVSEQPPIKSALVRCVPHCSPSALSFGLTSTPGVALRAPIWISWTMLVLGTAWLVARRTRSASSPVRRSLMPVATVVLANAALLLAFLAFTAAKLRWAGAVGAAYVECVIAIPLAILAGLATERMFMGRALAQFVSQLAQQPTADPERLMASAIQDPSLKISYRRPGADSYVDFSGAVAVVPEDRMSAWIERDGNAVAAVSFNADLAGQERFIQAAGAAALIRLERAQLEADLNASMVDLNASRARLVETAQAERRRLERDLHDGVQQHLVALRIKLELAAETVKEDPFEGQRALAALGQSMDGLLDELRSLARGIYPAVLQQRGLGDALKSAGRSVPVPIVVRALDLGRYSDDIEVAMYFCCLEALQNVAKHAGPQAQATVTLWQNESQLCFEVRDSGVGFDVKHVRPGSGLTNIRDRMQAIGGTVTISSGKGRATSVRGCVPVR